MCFAYGKTTWPKVAAPPLEPPNIAAPMARPTLPLTALRRHQVTLSLRDAELVELRRRASAARMPVPDYLRQRALSERLRVASPRRLAAAEFREVSRLAVNVNQIARLLASGPPCFRKATTGRGSSGCGRCSCSCSRRRRTDVICKLHRSGASFRGAVAYCLDEARDRDRDREADAPGRTDARRAITRGVDRDGESGHRRRPASRRGRWRRR